MFCTHSIGMAERARLCRGTVHSLRPREIAFVLPGSEYKQADLQRVHELAESKASDASVMMDAWEVSLTSSGCCKAESL